MHQESWRIQARAHNPAAPLLSWDFHITRPGSEEEPIETHIQEQSVYHQLHWGITACKPNPEPMVAKPSSVHLTANLSLVPLVAALYHRRATLKFDRVLMENLKPCEHHQQGNAKELINVWVRRPLQQNEGTHKWHFVTILECSNYLLKKGADTLPNNTKPNSPDPRFECELPADMFEALAAFVMLADTASENGYPNDFRSSSGYPDQITLSPQGLMRFQVQRPTATVATPLEAVCATPRLEISWAGRQLTVQ